MDPHSNEPQNPSETVLLVDDDPSLRAILPRILEKAGFSVSVAEDGTSCLRRASSEIFDAIVLDFMLPDLSGHEVSRQLRAQGITIPILMLTGSEEQDLATQSLDSGADDFLRKPADPEELAARLRALIRRGSYREFSVAGIQFDPMRHRITIRGEEIRLTKVEFLIFYTLVEARGDFVTRDQLLSEVWQMDFDPGTNLVYTHVANLRQKLAEHGFDSLLTTERGKGYQILLG